MTDRYTSIAGPTMHTGWMKKIGILEQQMVAALRNITEMQKRVKDLEDRPMLTAVVPESTVTTLFEANPPLPIKRGPGRPRKNP
jgi:hypothetical protein